MRKIYQSSQFDDKNVFRGKQKIQISAERTGVCEYMDATLGSWLISSENRRI